MSVLEEVNINPKFLDMDEDLGLEVKWHWEYMPDIPSLRKVPQIFFDHGEPWHAVNEYAIYKLQSVTGNNYKTVLSNMRHLKGYADWLDEYKIDWRHFPIRNKDRCLTRYRGYLICQRDEGVLAPSTTTARMNAVLNFYRWAQIHKWIERKPLWKDKLKTIRFVTTIGFSRSMQVVSSEYAIPNRAVPGSKLEDGLLPINDANRTLLLKYLQDHASIELYLIYLTGFYTGARSETIRTLRIGNIENAQDDPVSSMIKYIAVGPPTKIKTKNDVSGKLMVPKPLVDELLRYAYSVRRLTRQARASKKNTTLLFLTERGNPYAENTFTKLVSDLREKLVREGHGQFKEMKFHQTRATYGTQLMRWAMNKLPKQTDAIRFVRDAMLHKHESTTWKYVKFIENEPLKEKISEEFFNLFTGKAGDAQKLIAEVIYDEDT